MIPTSLSLPSSPGQSALQNPHSLRRRRYARRFAISGSILALLLSACTTHYRFTVDALRSANNSGAQPVSYRLVDGSEVVDDATTPPVDLASHVRAALSAQGLFEAPGDQAPDLEIEAAFSMVGPIISVRTRHEPTFIEPPPVSLLMPAGDGRMPVRVTRQPMNRIQNGERTVIERVSAYRKTLEVVARDARGITGADARELWRVRVFNDDPSDDARLYARLMVAAAMDLMGRDTDHSLEVVLSQYDERLALMRAATGT